MCSRRSSIALLSIVLISLSAVASGQGSLEDGDRQLVVPIVVNGSFDATHHFRTQFTFMNLSATTAVPTLKVYDDEGNDKTHILCSTACQPELDTLVGSGLLDIRTDGSEVLHGWASLEWNAPTGIQAQAEIGLIEGEAFCWCLRQVQFQIFSEQSSQVSAMVQVAGVQPATAWKAEAIVIRVLREKGVTLDRQTAYAIVNPSAEKTAQVTLRLVHSLGETHDSTSFTIGPLKRVAQFLEEFGLNTHYPFDVILSPPPRQEPFVGHLEISSDIPVAVGALHVSYPEGKWVNASAVPLPPSTAEE